MSDLDPLTNDDLAVGFDPLDANDYEVERDGVILHVMISEWRSDIAHVIERGVNGEGPDKGAFKPYDKMPVAEAQGRMLADGWSLKTTKQMIVKDRSPGYAQTVISGICSPDVTVEDVKKRFYHSYFGGARPWVNNGRFGCTIFTD